MSICDQYFEELSESRIVEEKAKIIAEAKDEGKPINERFDPSVYIDDKHSDCYNKVGRDTDNVDLCKSNSCINTIAKHKLDPEICYNIDSQEASQDCFEDVTDWVDFKAGGTENRYYYKPEFYP